MADSSEIPPLSIEELAALLPQYVVCGLIATGGMGAVYLAQQESLDRYVAIKVLPPQQDDEAGFTKRFKSEAKAMAKLMHNNIVAVYDFGITTMAHHYLVMEYVKGQTLHDCIREKKLKPEQVKAIILQLCDGLQFAHEHGIIHRDIKPANILIAEDGRVKIADFGLARQILAHEHEVVYGTPDYAAPEILHEGAKVDHRADVYALGIVLFEMLVGIVPGVTQKLPSAFVPTATVWDAIYFKATKSRPEFRYKDIKEMRASVTHVMAQTKAPPVLVPPQPIDGWEPVPAGSGDLAEPSMGGFMLKIGFIMLLFLGGWLWWHNSTESDQAPDVAKSDGFPIIQAEPHLPSTSEDMAVNPIASPAPLKGMGSISEDLPLSPTAVVDGKKKPDALDLKDVPVGHISKIQFQHRDPVTGIILFPDGTGAATTSMDGTIKVWDLVRGIEIRSFGPFEGTMQRLALTKDGRYLAAGSTNYTVRVWDVTTGKLVADATFPGRTINALAYSHDGTHLFIACSDPSKSFYQWAWTERSAEPQILSQWINLVHSMALTYAGDATGNRIFTVGGGLKEGGLSRDIWIGDDRSFSPSVKLSPRRTVSNRLAVTKNGQLLAVTLGSDIQIIDVEQDKDIALCKGHTGFVETLQFLSGGRFIISGSQDKTVRIWETSTGLEVFKLEEATWCTNQVAVSEDETWIVSAGGARFASPIQKDNDYAIHIWRLPNLGSLTTDQGRQAKARVEMANLQKVDPELSTLRDKLATEWESKKASVTDENKGDALNEKYLAALQREFKGVPQEHKEFYLSEISRIRNHVNHLRVDTSHWPDSLKRLYTIYVQQIDLLKDQTQKALLAVLEEQTNELETLMRSRESDPAARARVQIVMDELIQRAHSF